MGNSFTQLLLDNIFENTNPKILSNDFLITINDNLVQGRKNTKICELIYIGNNNDLQNKSLIELKQFEESNNTIIYALKWRDEKAKTDVIEYWIVTYDSEINKEGFIYNIFIDIGNDGYIDYVEWLPVENEEVNQ